MRFHVISLPHTVTSKEYLPCAYTQKVYNFCKMMHSLGHEVYHYGGEGSNPPCSEHVSIISAEQRRQWWGGNDWRREFFDFEYDVTKDYWRTSNANAIREIKKRARKQDFICVIAGLCQKPIADAFRNHITVEYGVGYSGVFSKFRVFESYAWMHYLYGCWNHDGFAYDTVIPNYFDPVDFPLIENKEDYFLFVGRVVQRKGLDYAVAITKEIGAKLVIAGQGVTHAERGKIVSPECTILGDHVEYVGTVNVEQRGLLMGRAQALFAPTHYIGPFEGVSVESLFCGTPVITTDWGCFAENNIDGSTGYRVRTLGEGAWAATNLDKLWRPARLRDYAIGKFSIDTVRYRYEEYFKQLLTLWDKGWYTTEYAPIKRESGGFC